MKTQAPFILFSLLLSACSQKEMNMSSNFPAQGRFPAADSLELFYQFKGAGPDTLVMIHGGPGLDAGSLMADFGPLAQNHTLLYYDQRGGGRSDLPDTMKAGELLHIDRHVADLEGLRRHFGFEKMTLVAHSFGPMLAAKYALAYPDKVEKMILIGPVPPFAGDFEKRYSENINSRLIPEQLAKMDSLGTAMITGADPHSACREYWNLALIPRLAKGLPVNIVKADLCTAPEEGMRYGLQYTGTITWTSLGNWDLRDALRSLNVPTLIIHGEEESIPMDMVEEWANVMPNAELKKIPKAAHFPYVERPDLVWPMMEDFLKPAE